MSQTYHHWQKERKYYNIYIQPNLFGGFSVIKSWGSLDTKRSGQQISFCDSIDATYQLIEKINKRRLARGYVAL